ncbi:hypothetical protein HDU77_000968, partial [Chytriomyces hyalinus]
MQGDLAHISGDDRIILTSSYVYYQAAGDSTMHQIAKVISGRYYMAPLRKIPEVQLITKSMPPTLTIQRHLTPGVKRYIKPRLLVSQDEVAEGNHGQLSKRIFLTLMEKDLSYNAVLPILKIGSYMCYGEMLATPADATTASTQPNTGTTSEPQGTTIINTLAFKANTSPSSEFATPSAPEEEATNMEVDQQPTPTLEMAKLELEQDKLNLENYKRQFEREARFYTLKKTEYEGNLRVYKNLLKVHSQWVSLLKEHIDVMHSQTTLSSLVALPDMLDALFLHCNSKDFTSMTNEWNQRWARTEG